MASFLSPKFKYNPNIPEKLKGSYLYTSIIKYILNITLS